MSNFQESKSINASVSQTSQTLSREAVARSGEYEARIVELKKCYRPSRHRGF
jgi:hypothetical protein